ncbi:MAG: hypothetical protein L6R28_04215 [Planctomycetes bacterium]|nr:hypothetical protein [Planctomycetota bacterium]
MTVSIWIDEKTHKEIRRAAVARSVEIGRPTTVSAFIRELVERELASRQDDVPPGDDATNLAALGCAKRGTEAVNA